MTLRDEALFFDIESYGADEMWDRTPRDMFRLGQYSWGRKGKIILTRDYDELLDALRSARLVIGHNIHSFDLTVMFGKDSTEPLQMALDKRILDTFTWASLVYPSPTVWTDKNGHTFYNGNEPGVAMKWLGLDNLNFQFGLPGKMGSLRDIAKRYNPPKTSVKNLDYGLIPLDDEEFLGYAEQDIVAVRALALKLLEMPGGVTPYIWREQLFAAICAQNSRNGWKVDVEKAQQRVDYLAERKEQILEGVVTKYGLPTEGKAPWSTKDGKAAIFAALSDYGISPETRPDWPKTATNNPSLGGEAILMLTEGTPAEDLGIALAELKGQRSLAALALDSMKSDGMIHPSITALQRSGRLSTTKPGLTVWTARGKGAIEKEYFIARPGYKLVSFDYSNADARAVAGYSGDKEYIKRFAPGVDAHELTGRLVWGDEVYDSDPKAYRQQAKMCVHAYSYGARPKTLSFQTGLPIEVTTAFCERMDRTYGDVVKWQRNSAEQGKTGWITNDWGRRMPVDKARAFTQSSALLGQSGTREILVDGLINLARKDVRYITMLKAQIHDEIVMEIPEKEVDKTIAVVVDSMSTLWKPQVGGQQIEFTLSYGEPADNWYEAGH
jgi:DNA polymerase I - 3''-5'' exonuclease and polymerase domains